MLNEITGKKQFLKTYKNPAFFFFGKNASQMITKINAGAYHTNRFH